ncbi:cytochrome P450 CYP72A616-like [Actinidia eriantha]|uniref:cytochrome P450 CYP72A616-like n=1 Tax=Actinidia eriantha TaxID=165200 RepID=UPI00258819CD|nr:cytochrome P450 CYP72A616-like [Actinidia eriantha]
METHTFFPLIISCLLFLYCVLRVCYSIWWKPKLLEKKLKRQGIRGTPYKLLIGDMKEYMRQITQAWSTPLTLTHQIMPRVDPFTHNIVEKYGKVCLCWFGTTPRLIIQDPELMKEVLSNKLGHFGGPPVNQLILILTRGLTTLEGEKWAQHRRIINPAFHLEKLKGMIPDFATSCGLLIEKWTKSIVQTGTCETDVWLEFQDLTGDIISRTAFGSNFEEGKKILQLQKELQVLVIEAMQTLYIPGFRFIPTKKNRTRKSLDRRITSMLKTLIQRKESEITSGKSKGDDLLGILLQSNKEEKNSLNKGMTIEEVIEECKLFYLAGHETTSNMLTWTMIVLAMHQNWQHKARQEVMQVCGETSPDFEAISHLKIMTMILYEVLRLYPPVIAHYKHTYKETKLGNTLSIPAGVAVTLPTLLIHHDPDLWGDDAPEFKPERFSQGVSKASADCHLAFFPFGWGPRTCIGQNFALIEAKVALAVILQHFWFELSPSYAHAPQTGMTLQPQHGAQIVLHKLG